MKTFTALALEENGQAAIKTFSDNDLPPGDVTVDVAYSSLNYKDGLVLNRLGNLVKTYPHVPGIDFAGVVSDSKSKDFKPGDKVILTGWRVGEACWGGYATLARVRPEWLIRLPEGLSLKQAMALGTAGVAAMMAVLALEEHGLKPGDGGEILVTGAAGGVGSISVALLANLGHKVAASTGRAKAHDYLKSLGAEAIIERLDLAAPLKGALLPARFAGAIDNVGGFPLASVLASLRPLASCAAVGLTASPRLEGTLMPFLLRGVNLLGIDSVACPQARRVKIWRRLASDMPLAKLESIAATAPLSKVVELGSKILQGQIRGRIVIDVRATD